MNPYARFDFKRRKEAIKQLIDSIKTIHLCIYNEEIEKTIIRKINSPGGILFMPAIHFHKYIAREPNKRLIDFVNGNIIITFSEDRFYKIPIEYAKNHKVFASQLWTELNMYKITDEEIEILVSKVQELIIESL